MLATAACRPARKEAPRDAAAAGPIETTVPAAPAAAPDAAPRDDAPAEAPLIPAGVYLMGSPTGRGDVDEQPAHEAIVAAFYLDKTEVTMDAYAACVRDGACTPTHDAHPFCNTRHEGREEHPVNCVDAAQADAYCAHVGKRLPREREWEWASRGGVADHRFSWGNELPDTRRACYMHASGTCKVGSFAPGAFGLFDMSGNVWEWTSSYFVPYPDEPAAGGLRIYRGGSWSRRFPKWLRNEIRNRYKPTEWSAALGIRCAKTKLPVECPPDTAPTERGDDCTRVSGTPLCENGRAWNGKACTPGGGAQPVGESWARGSATTPTGEPSIGPTASVAPEPAPITRARTPQYDDDCHAHFPGRPNAYVYAGGTFGAREPIVAASGCAKRDVGRFGTSICCAE